ncbi:MAG: TetR/AcrR family transcriptional regulator [Actinomycetota bacterium]|nr:TetR/AcrR family transcriptional regulator [Actinomycetota bacterium]
MDGKATTARERARTEITAEILAAARSRLTQQGPGELSLRAVARDVGMVSSAVYRYFASRDELLTALLIAAYNDLGAAAEDADAAVKDRTAYLKRWTAACTAIRGWALSHPGDYALLYGSPVPGYAAPQDTIPAATRVTLVLVRIVTEAHENGAKIRPAPANAPADVDSLMQGALDYLKTQAIPAAEPAAEVALRTISAWSAIFGTISFELFGHLVGSVSDYDTYFDQVVIRLADELGLA